MYGITARLRTNAVMHVDKSSRLWMNRGGLGPGPGPG